MRWGERDALGNSDTDLAKLVNDAPYASFEDIPGGKLMN
jgi:hypothetical protein